MKLSNPEYITDGTGRKLSVVLPYKEYEWMLEELKERHSISSHTKPSGKVSDLRGKISPLTNEQIDEQFKVLRGKWQNDI